MHTHSVVYCHRKSKVCLLRPPGRGVPVNLSLSVSPYVCLYFVTTFSRNLFIAFFLKKNPEIEIEKQKKWQRWIFKKKIVDPKMGPKMERFFLVFTKFFHHFLQDERPCISLFPCISYFSIFCFTNHRPKCSHPVRLQDSLTINISERNP